VLTLIRRTLGRVGRILSVLAVLLTLFQVSIVAVAASLQESHGFDRIAGLLPAFIQQGFGPALTSFPGMAGLGFFEPLIVMLVVQFAIYLATEPAGDVESGLVDLILARPLPRHRLVTRSLLVMTGATVTLSMTMVLSLYASLWVLAPQVAAWPTPHVVFLLMAHLTAVAWCFGGAALAAAAWSRRRGLAQSAVAVAAVAFYLMEVVGEAWSRAAWASWLSPFHRFHGSGILSGQTNPGRDLTILGTLGLAGVLLAYWQFSRRDV
jgi:hypothetical protein